MTLVVYRSHVAVSRQELFDFHAHVSNLARISPPFPRVRIEEPQEPTREGDLQRIVMEAGPLRRNWDARVSRVVPGSLIEDVQERGPFRRWRHQHRFEEAGPGRAVLTDAISFAVLPSPVGAFVEYVLVRPAVWLMLAWRHRKTRTFLEGPGRRG